MIFFFKKKWPIGKSMSFLLLNSYGESTELIVVGVTSGQLCLRY